MYALKCAVERGRRVVTIAQSKIDNLHVAVLQIERGLRHSPPADVFGKRHIGHIGKHPLKMKTGAARELGNLIQIDLFRKVVFDIAKRAIELCQPIHTIVLMLQCYRIWMLLSSESLPDFERCEAESALHPSAIINVLSIERNAKNHKHQPKAVLLF
ncbi:hypothetical protein SDC9_103587 [bioreactor metagenome]|uniref:Uncharacterized protein n=1 Tax=bioreactor metagenome TaxID=1076179 RepID=A0A645B0U3_9ZZZZ